MPVERRGWVTHGVCWVNGRPEELSCLAGRRQPSLSGTSRMRRESHVRICERLGVRFPGPTRRKVVIRRRSFSPDLFSSAARYDYARVNKTDLGHLRKTRFTLTAQKKCDQLIVSAPARGGTTALGEIILPLTSG